MVPKISPASKEHDIEAAAKILQQQVESLSASAGGLRLALRRKVKSALDFADSDLVISTHNAILGVDRDSPLNQIHWWRVVIDESQMLKEPKGAHAMTHFLTADKLPRVHSWLMSGTPAGNVVEDLLGQLLFLGVEPYCRMGVHVDNFWTREVTER